MTETTWVTIGRKPEDTDAEWSAACKEMAAFLQADLDARRIEAGTGETNEDSVRREAREPGPQDAPKKGQP